MKTQFHFPIKPARLARALTCLPVRRSHLWTRLWPAALAFAIHPARADVTEAWVQRHNGPANRHDKANAVAVDSGGNVVVTGSSARSLDSFGYPIYDYYTAKYAAADGSLLWEKRYNSPANGDDRVVTSRSLALGPNGMVVITGSSGGDYATVVYRETLPPAYIERVPAGVRLHFKSLAGGSYNIERAPAITGPWTHLATVAAPHGANAVSLIEYIDKNPSADSAYSRTVQP